ncbi:MAG: hypothetical protein ABI718_14740 [Acidobacteriota bacterium]
MNAKRTIILILVGCALLAVPIDSYAQWSTSGTSIYYNNNVGIGTVPNSLYRLHVLGDSVLMNVRSFAVTNTINQDGLFAITTATNFGTYFSVNAPIAYAGFFSHVTNSTNWFTGMLGTPSFVIRQHDAAVDRVTITTAGAITLNGNVTVTGTINAKYQDLAEWVPSSEALEDGNVVVLDTRQSNQVRSSRSAYDTAVAGVVSATPGIVLGEGGEGRYKIATTGRVRIRVDASRNPIGIGDLLVTSSVPGVAMKSEAVNVAGVKMHRPGTIVAKALEPLRKGQGEILALLTLQ